jgi:AcrR family transcriptional regulator
MTDAIRVRRGSSAQGRAEVRRELVAAAAGLFDERGYEDTTVDDIASAAGVGRRTFFRYFRSKEDAISPDHGAALARVAGVFATAPADEPTRDLVLRAGETVFELYTTDPALSLLRYRLTHRVPVLRDRESASVDHYRRLFTRVLRDRFAGEPDGDLRAAVTAAAVVAAHNLALREWLAAGAPDDGGGSCRRRFRQVGDMLPVEPARDQLHAVARRLEAAADRLERSRPA